MKETINKLILLDSCILMLPAEKKVNLSQLESFPFLSKIMVPKIILKELENLVLHAKPSIQRKARLALSIAKQYEIFPSRTEGHADDELIRLAKEHNAIVATTDVNLRKRLHIEKIAYITLVGKKELKVFGEI